MNKSVSILTVLAALIITIIMGIFALKVKMDPDFNSLLPRSNKRLEALNKNFGIKDSVTQYIFLSVEGDDNFTIDKLNKFKNIISKIASLKGVTRTINPFNFITLTGSGKKIVPKKMTSVDVFRSKAEVMNFKKRLLTDTIAKNFVVSDHGRILTAIFSNTQISDINSFMAELTVLTNKLKGDFTVHISGEIPINYRTGFYLAKDLKILLIISILVMLTIFFLSFRTKRSFLLPLIVVVTGIIWTTGFMALTGYKFTIVSITIPTLLLAVGSSYVIHLLSEYYRGIPSNKAESREWISEALSHSKKTILLAAITTVIGFSSLLLTSITPVRQFGLAVSFGITVTALFSTTLLPALFYLLPDSGVHKAKEVQNGFITTGLLKITSYSLSKPFVSVFGALILILAAVLLYPHIERQTNYLSYYPENDKVIADTKFIIEHSGGSQALNITLEAPNKEKNFFLNPAVMNRVETFENELQKNNNILSLLSFNTVIKNLNKIIHGKNEIPRKKGMTLLLSRYFKMIPEDGFSLGDQVNLISKNGSYITIFTKVFNSETHQFLTEKDTSKLIGVVNRDANKFLPKNIKAHLWGNTVLYQESTNILNRDQLISTIVSLILVFIVTAVSLKSIYYGLLSLLPITMGICVYFLVIEVFRVPLDMTTVLVTNIAIGVGLDDAIHFMVQYDKQRKLLSGSTNDSILRTVQIAGRPIVLTTLAIMAGLGVLCLASFKPVVNFGMLMGVTLLAAMISTVILLPTLIKLSNSKKRIGESTFQ